MQWENFLFHCIHHHIQMKPYTDTHTHTHTLHHTTCTHYTTLHYTTLHTPHTLHYTTYTHYINKQLHYTHNTYTQPCTHMYTPPFPNWYPHINLIYYGTTYQKKKLSHYGASQQYHGMSDLLPYKVLSNNKTVLVTLHCYKIWLLLQMIHSNHVVTV